VLETLSYQAQVFLRAHNDGHPDVTVLLRGHGPAFDEKIDGSFSLEHARALVAKEHGFKDWDEVLRNATLRIDADFEAAVDAVIHGKLTDLQRLLNEAPYLVHARSTYPHHSTLLHHCSANGIEHTRQWQSPANAPDIARALLAAGADPDATCDVYRGGGSTTPLCLLVSSGPPALAGVQDDLVEVLCKGGADPDGVDGYRPLWTAIIFCYARAAERLAACGASVDNVIFAAATGNLHLVRDYVAAGREQMAKAPSAQRIGADGPALEPAHMLEYALIYASGHARVAVVEFLLSQGPDLMVKDPWWGATALGMARYDGINVSGRPDDIEATIKLLEAAVEGRAGG
jgi:hypothetical protein